MEHEIRFLPYSGRRITLDATGRVFINNELLDLTLIDGECHVKFGWMFGEKYYSIALLMIVTFLPMHLPDFLWERITPLFKDGNHKNHSLSNLTYGFKNGFIEVPDYPSFYYVPFYTMYGINKEGILINATSGKLLSWYVVKPNVARNSTGGYKACRAVVATGITKVLFRHRALALVFKKYDANIDTLIINHRDGDPSNDDIDNLEWTTYSQNNLHAYKKGLRPNSAFPILVKHVNSDLITEYVNIQEAARDLGMTGSNVGYRLNNCYGKLFDDGLLFLKVGDKRGFPTTDMLIRNKDRRPRDVLCTDTSTGETYIFDDRASCSVFLKVSTATVAKYIDNGSLVFGKYSLKLV